MPARNIDVRSRRMSRGRSWRCAGFDPALDRVALLAAKDRAAERHDAVLGQRARLGTDRDEEIALRGIARYDAHPAGGTGRCGVDELAVRLSGLEVEPAGAERGAEMASAERTR